MQVKAEWLVTQVSVLTMTVIVIYSLFSSVFEIEIKGVFFALALLSFFLAVAVPIVRFLFLHARTRESSE
ncbi:hypothetical protein JT27_13130 [Alcaligenes faecalis]|nr:hypothetical protein JT27_13130 [Alcaligenes faecalis]